MKSILSNTPFQHRRLFIAFSLLLFLTNRLFAQEAPLLEWAGHFKGAGGVSDNFGYGVATDAAGNVYSTGSYSGTTDFDPGSGVFNLTSAFGSEDIYISKLDNNGNFAWAVSIGQGVLDAGYSIAVDAGGNVYTTGTYRGNVDFDPGPGIFTLAGSALNYSFILKLDTDGNFLWAKPISAGSTVGSGRGIALDNSNNVLVTGIYSGTVDFDPGAGIFNMTSAGGDDIYTIKLDANGNFVWAKSMGGAGFDRGFSISIDNSNNVLTTGSYSGVVDFDPGAGLFSLTAVGSTDIFISKLDANGNFVWAKSMGGLDGETGNSLTTDGLNNVIITGRFKTTVDFDPGAAVFNLSTGSSNEDGFIAKLDANGNFGWAVSIGGSTLQGDSGKGITTDVSGNVLVTGYFEGTVDFDFGAGTFNLTSALFGTDIYLLKLDTNGNFIWAVQTGGNNDRQDEGNAITVDAIGNIWSTGSYSTAADFDFGPCIFQLIAEFNTDVNTYVEKISTGNFGPPTITSFSPTSGPIGTTITITGTNFSIIPGDNRVTFNGGAVAFGSASTTTSITTAVPAGALSGNIGVTVGCYPIAVSVASFIVTTGGLPTITSFTPPSGSIGTTVTITGTNFNTTPANNIVYFGATRASITAATSTQLTVTVPVGATYQPISVEVNGSIAYSSNPFVVTFADGGVNNACSFETKKDFATGIGPQSISLGDLDGDGKAEMVVTNVFDNNLSVLRNTTTGPANISYSARVNFTTGTRPASVTMGDLDGDGKLDLAVANETSNTISVFRNTSSGVGNISFAAKIDFATANRPMAISIGDFDKDGKTDLVAVNRNSSSISVFRNTSTAVGNINYATRVDFTAGTGAQSVATADFDSDGKLDVVVTNESDFTISIFRNTSSGAGNINYATKLDFATGPNPIWVATGDLDGDGKTDVAAVTSDNGAISVLRNSSSGAGNINYDAMIEFTTGSAYSVSISDMDGDGKLDLAAGNSTGTVSILRNVSSGAGNINHGFITDFIAGGSPQSVAIGDVDGDGKNDLAVANSGSDNISVLRNTVSSLPMFTSSGFTPTSGSAGTIVTFTGTNFSATPLNNTIKFNGVTALVTASSSTSITAIVPVGATTGPVSIQIGCITAISIFPFTVTAGSSIAITTQPVDLSVCINDIASFTTAATGTTNITYQWQFSPNTGTFSDINNGSSFSGVTTATLSVNTANSFGAGQYRCRINGDLAPEVITNSATLSITNCGNNQPPVIVSETTSVLIEGVVTIDLVPLISDPDDNLNLQSLQLVNTISQAGASASINTSFELTLDYGGILFLGNDFITISVCDLLNDCIEQELSIEVAGDIIVYNAVSPNNDDKNEILYLKYIDVIPQQQKNVVSIYNRWGSKVFEVDNYNNDDRVFKGVGTNGNELPSGTYFYKIVFPSNQEKEKTGYLVLKR